MLEVAILCGGLATRLRPITQRVPKSLLELNGEPFIAHQLRLLSSRGVSRVVLCVGYLGEMIRDCVGDGSRFGLRADFSFDGPALLGTAGAVRNALPLLPDSFLVLYGDSYLTCDYESVACAFLSSGKSGLLTVYRNDDRYDASNVEYANGRILRYDKKERTPEMRHIDYGLGAFRSAVFSALPPQEPRDLAQVYRDLLQAGQLLGFEVFERFYEIGSPEGLRETARYLASRSGPPLPRL